MVQTQYQNMGKGCEGILPQGKGLQNLRKLRKEVVIYKNRQINSFQKVSEGSTGKKIEEKISILKFSTEFDILLNSRKTKMFCTRRQFALFNAVLMQKFWSWYLMERFSE